MFLHYRFIYISIIIAVQYLKQPALYKHVKRGISETLSTLFLLFFVLWILIYNQVIAKQLLRSIFIWQHHFFSPKLNKRTYSAVEAMRFITYSVGIRMRNPILSPQFEFFQKLPELHYTINQYTQSLISLSFKPCHSALCKIQK